MNETRVLKLREAAQVWALWIPRQWSSKYGMSRSFLWSSLFVDCRLHRGFRGQMKPNALSVWSQVSSSCNLHRISANTYAKYIGEHTKSLTNPPQRFYPTWLTTISKSTVRFMIRRKQLTSLRMTIRETKIVRRMVEEAYCADSGFKDQWECSQEQWDPLRSVCKFQAMY